MASHSDADIKRYTERFTAAGLAPGTVSELVRNEKLSAKLDAVFTKAEAFGGPLEKQRSVLAYSATTKFPNTAVPSHLDALIKLIAERKIKSEHQLLAALEFIRTNPTTLDQSAFEIASGVGVVVTREDVKKVTKQVIEENKAELVAQRYKFNNRKLLDSVKKQLPWADGKDVTAEVDAQVLELLGPKTEEDNKKSVKTKAEKPETKLADVPSVSHDAVPLAADVEADEHSFNGTVRKFHAVGENYKTDGYVVTPKTMELLAAHVKRVGGKVHTRFPPEPNGILHIGHAKAMFLNFNYAKLSGGNCYFRYDDTNPEKEEERFYTGILDMVRWLGHQPYKITNASDYFPQLFDYAMNLVHKDLAYVCHQNADDMKLNLDSPWRNRPVEESVRLFQDMSHGKIDEGKATLRLKHTMADGKKDPVAYRIRFVHHLKAGDKWCVYPTYDYSHCLVDSFEDITHSLCTKEFQIRRPTYYWVCNAGDVYCPVQWEYGRLSIQHTVMSKRKIQKLIELKKVNDWDDPRLHTLMGLRRRGFPPAAINNFIEKIGVTEQNVFVEPALLEACARDELNPIVPRSMVVLHPLKVTIVNEIAEEGKLSVENIPGDEKSGKHEIALSRTVYIDQSDFRKEADKHYRRLTLKQTVGLRYAGLVLTVQDVVENNGEVVEVKCTAAKADANNKPKAFIHWVCNPITVEVRQIDVLFKHKFPEDQTLVPEGWLENFNPNSLVVIKNAYADAHMKGAPVGTQYQFERTGFYAVDSDSKGDRLVYNLIVGLKEDKGK